MLMAGVVLFSGSLYAMALGAPRWFGAITPLGGLSLIGAIVGEFLASNAGLGYLIIYGQNIFNMSLVMTSLVILTIIAGVMYYGVTLLERILIPWRRD